MFFSAKSMGLNAIRVIGKTPHPYLMQLADRYGLYVLAETPVTIPPVIVLTQESFRQYVITALRQFTQVNGNHPSLLAVGPGFGIPTKGVEEEIAVLFGQLKREVSCWTYLSTPLPLTIQAADFQIWERLPLLSSVDMQLPEAAGPLLAGNIGIYLDPLPVHGNDPGAEIRQTQSLLRMLQQPWVNMCAGFVLNSLNDYQLAYPLLTRTPSAAPFLLPTGVISFPRNERTSYVRHSRLLEWVGRQVGSFWLARENRCDQFYCCWIGYSYS